MSTYRSTQERTDASGRTVPGILSEVLSGIGLEYGRRLSRRAKLLPMTPGRGVANHAARTVDGQLGAVIGIRPVDDEPWLGPVIDAWTQSNVALIGGVGPRHMAGVEQLVREAWDTGKRAEWLARELEGRLGISERRAMLIARDQVGKLNGALQMLRQSSYGVAGYIWATSLDERVRQLHADRDGEKFLWANPPEDGHPGMPIQCRCVPEPDIEDQLAELERLGEEELVMGPPDEELLAGAVRDLGQWAPNPADVNDWVAAAVAGVRAFQAPRSASDVVTAPGVNRPVRRPPRSARAPARASRPTPR